MFVSIEGIDASGKTTVVREVARLLKQDRLSVDLLRDFATSRSRAPNENAVQKSIFFSLGFEEGSRAALLYMLYHEAVKWEQADGFARDLMIADRFLDSIVAYQGHFLPAASSSDAVALGHQIEGLLRQLGIPIPQVTYLLDVSPDISAARFANREGRQLTKFEFGHISQIRASFVALANGNSRIKLVDASHSLEDVVELIHEDLRKQLTALAAAEPPNAPARDPHLA